MTAAKPARGGGVMVNEVVANYWTDERLGYLFQKYRVRYWPNSRRLRVFKVQRADLRQRGGAHGRCENELHLITIDVARHWSERELRATMLHEMIHAVVGRPGHGASFWTQLEYLLSEKAPITVSFPELGEHGDHLCIIPARFRRCRRLFAPAFQRRRRSVERQIAKSQVAVREYTAADMEGECDDAAVAGTTWAAVWGHQARTWGLVDLDGRLLPWGRKWHEAARRGYVRGRRFYLENERAVRALCSVLEREKGGE